MPLLVRTLCFALMTAFLALLFAGAAQAQSAADEAQIHDIIARQLDAIDRGDGSAAFALASPSIQTLFQGPETFIDMVARGYPQLLHARRHRFLKLEMMNGALTQRVLIDGEKGSVVARYEMIMVEGQWRINGCMLEARQDA